MGKEEEDGEYRLPYFTKKKILDHCPRKTRCKKAVACTHVRGRYARKNPWTGRKLRKRVREDLRHDCDVYEARKRRKTTEAAEKRKKTAEKNVEKEERGRWTDIVWRDYHEKEFVVQVRTSILRDHGIHRIEEPALGFGGYWSVYPISAKRALKVNVVHTEAIENLERKERDVYPVAEAHHVGPEIYEWFHVRDPDVRVVSNTPGRRAKSFRYVAFAVVERYEGHVTAETKKLAGYTKKMLEADDRVMEVEEMHGIKLGDRKGVNYLVNVAGGRVTKLVVGDWGSTNPKRFHKTYDCTDHR